MRRLLIGVGIALLIAAPICLFVYREYYRLYHFRVVQEGVLYRSGIANMPRYANTYRWHPFKSVVNIQSLGEREGNYRELATAEAQFCAERGIRMLYLPLGLGKPPTPEQVQDFLKWMDDPAHRPVLLHDSQGVVREGIMVAVWQMERMGLTPEQAEQAIVPFGRKDLVPLRAFLRDYHKFREGK